MVDETHAVMLVVDITPPREVGVANAEISVGNGAIFGAGRGDGAMGR